MKDVTIHHPVTGHEATVKESAVIHHEASGWKRGPKPAAQTTQAAQTAGGSSGTRGTSPPAVDPARD